MIECVISPDRCCVLTANIERDLGQLLNSAVADVARRRRLLFHAWRVKLDVSVKFGVEILHIIAIEVVLEVFLRAFDLV